MTKRIAALAALAVAAASGVASAQLTNGAPVHSFRYGGSPEAALARLRLVLQRCWNDEYDSRVHGPYQEAADVPSAIGPSGATIRLDWIRLVRDRPAGLLKRGFELRLQAEGGTTRVSVVAFVPRPDVGRDVEAWLAGRDKCFAGRYPSP
ncbi:MAG: hypothetical protein KIT16_16840 [Rhodospirillaceae bacterium]|nr:hypothetical protein [Rhodospirillaceae bacterium]